MSDTTGHDDLSRVEALLNELDASDLELLDPPADVWAGIEAELGDEAVATAADVAPVVSLAERRNRWMRPVLAVAAAAAIVVVGAAVVFTGDDAEVLAAADLTYDAAAFDPLGEGASATAELVEGDDGFEIVLTDSSLPSDLAENADLELWLIEADADGNLVDVASVALVEGAGSYAVPASIDVDTHRIVDISVEPRDGDDAHSGRSILRGTLDA